MYMRNLIPLDHLIIFMMVVSLSPCNFRDIAPPAWRECTPTRSGLIPAFSSSRIRIAVGIAVMRSSGMTFANLCFSLMNSHKYDECVLSLLSIWCTCLVSALTGLSLLSDNSR